MAEPKREHFFDGVDPIDPQVIALSRRSIFKFFGHCPFAARVFGWVWDALCLPNKYNIFNLYGGDSKALKAPLYKNKRNYFTFRTTPYRVFQIADETRPGITNTYTGVSGTVLVSQDMGEKRIKLGIGLTESVKSNLLDYICKVDVSLNSSGRSFDQSFSFPVNGSDDVCRHRLGESWLDWFMDIPFEDPKDIEIYIKAEFKKDRKAADTKSAESIIWSAPQVVSKNRNRKCHKVLFLSIESLTDPLFLKKNFGLKPDTPYLNRLAIESEVYPIAYAQGDATLPSAGAYLTGLMPTQHGVVDYFVKSWSVEMKNPSPNILTLAEILKDANFYTKAGTSFPRYSSRYGWHRGFDSYKNHSYHYSRPMLCSRFAVNFLEETRDIDSFLFMHWDGLHDDFWVSQPQNCFTVQNKGKDKNVFRDKSIYEERLRYMDLELGIIMDYLKSSKLWDETLLIVTADHGWGYGTWEKKSDFCLFEDRIRVPLMIKYPKSERIAEIKKPVNASILPFFTILEVLDIKFPSYYESLPQKTMLDGMAITETVMQPKREDYSMSIVSSEYKYHFRAIIDWQEFKLAEIKYERLFEIKGNYAPDESRDVSRFRNKEVEKFRGIARDVLVKNLNFLRQNQPVDLLSLPV